uniref:Uncharacterized protein n=1 Tax=Arundo donax TaxID=35708 RepID=A0A0A9EGA1_ARUDO
MIDNINSLMSEVISSICRNPELFLAVKTFQIINNLSYLTRFLL